MADKDLVLATEPLGPNFAEDEVWERLIKPVLEPFLGKGPMSLCEYACCEMLNNANDHSGADEVLCHVTQLSTGGFRIIIHDPGVGIFNKLVEDLKLDDVRHAVFELCKGKLTTDPDRHTGEGIFFSSRMFERFAILSGGVMLAATGKGDLVLGEEDEADKGTLVAMEIDPKTTKTPQDIFDHYASGQDDYGFKKTVVNVDLAHGERTLVSRSQGRRIVSRLDKFTQVLLDFEKIDTISPAFADEIFRVFARKHPNLSLTEMNANPSVKAMIHKARAAASQSED